MAKRVLKAAFLSINGVDHSSSASSIQLELEAEAQDATTYGSLGWSENLQGLKSGNLSVTFKDDFASGALDQLLWAMFDAGVNVPFEVRVDQAARSATNPSYTGQLCPTQHSLGGDVGDVAEKEIEWPTSGQVQRLVA